MRAESDRQPGRLMERQRRGQDASMHCRDGEARAGAVGDRWGKEYRKKERKRK